MTRFRGFIELLIVAAAKWSRLRTLMSATSIGVAALLRVSVFAAMRSARSIAYRTAEVAMNTYSRPSSI